MRDPEFVAIGEVVKPHGLRGELSIALHADSPSLLDRLPGLYLGEPGRGLERFKPAGWRRGRERVILRLAGIDGRDQAERLRGLSIWARTDELPRPAEDEVYLHQLLGVDVLLPGGERLGRLERFLETGGAEVWSIRTEAGVEVLFPAEPAFVVSLDLAARVVVIDPPPGLLDLYLA